MDDCGIDVKRLSLIDVSFEDDCLIDSPFARSPFAQPSPSPNHSPDNLKPSESQADERCFGLAGMQDLGRASNGGKSVSFSDQVLKTPESEGTKNAEKYNLRKSLAWDTAFFTSAGVLEPDELTSMIEGTENSEKQALPRILEETQRSTDSISTLASDSLTIASLEAELFEDIRASIQKSGKAYMHRTPSDKNGPLISEPRTHQSLKKIDLASHGKLKPKPSSKSTSLGNPKSAKTANPVSVHPRVLQVKSTSIGGRPDSLSSRPPKPGKLSPAQSSAKRDSIGAHRFKAEKINPGVAGRRASASKMHVSGIASGSLPGSSSSRLSSSSAAALTSSVDSSVSGSSTSTGKSPLNSKKQRDGSKSRKFSSASTPKTPPKSARSHLAEHLLSASKLSSSISPASSISEWSSASSSSTSTAKQSSNSARTSIGTSSYKVREEDDAHHALKCQKPPKDQRIDGHKPQGSAWTNPNVRSSSTGGATVLLPNSVKPSGLRMPSPKIGFFDGVKSGRTPNGIRQSSHVVLGGSPKIGAEVVSADVRANEVKVGKLQSARSAMTNKSKRAENTKQSASGTTSRSLQETSSSSEKLSSASRTVKRSPGISPKALSSSPKHGEGSRRKAQEIKSKKYNEHVRKPDSIPAEENGRVDMLRDKESPEIKSIASNPTGGEPTILNAPKVDKINEAGVPDPAVNVETGVTSEKLSCVDSSLQVPDYLCPKNAGEKEPLNCYSKLLPPSPLSDKIDQSACVRMPFAAIDSFYNVNGSSDASVGLAAAQVESRITSSSPNDLFDEKS